MCDYGTTGVLEVAATLPHRMIGHSVVLLTAVSAVPLVGSKVCGARLALMK